MFCAGKQLPVWLVSSPLCISASWLAAGESLAQLAAVALLCSSGGFLLFVAAADDPYTGRWQIAVLKTESRGQPTRLPFRSKLDNVLSWHLRSNCLLSGSCSEVWHLGMYFLFCSVKEIIGFKCLEPVDWSWVVLF